MKQGLKFLFIVCSAATVNANASTFVINKSIRDANCNGANDGQIVLTVSGGFPPYYYSWSSGQTTSAIYNLAPGSYTVHLVDTQTGDSIFTITISEKTCEISAEQVFTPNGDGINDTWNIYNTQFYPEFLVKVYNRWGQKVYEQSGTYTAWDGTENGLKLPDATYYYIIYKDKNKKEAPDIIKGPVTIIR